MNEKHYYLGIFYDKLTILYIKESRDHLKFKCFNDYEFVEVWDLPVILIKDLGPYYKFFLVNDYQDEFPEYFI